jgi:hypothetical protein
MCTRTFFTRVLEGHINIIVWEFKSIPLFANVDIFFMHSHVTLLKPKIKKTKILQLFTYIGTLWVCTRSYNKDLWNNLMKEDYIARNMISSKPQWHSTFLPTVYYLCFLFNSSCFEMLAPRLVILIYFRFSSVTLGILWGCSLRVHHDYILYNVSCTHISAFRVTLQWESRH